MSGHLIPEHARKLLEEQDAARAKARATNPTEKDFQNSFKHSFAAEIELIRLGAVVTEVGYDKFGNPKVLAVRMPDGKKVPTNAVARRRVWWSRRTRPIRNLYNRVKAFVKRLWSR